MMAVLLLQTGGAGSSLGMFLPMIIVMGIFYVMLILPQQRQRKNGIMCPVHKVAVLPQCAAFE